MKRIYLTLALFGAVLFSTHEVKAQNFVYEFADEAGTIIADGSFVTITKAEVMDDGSGDIMMNSGIYVKNIDGDADDLVRLAYDVQAMDNGSFQICFPVQCSAVNSVRSGATEPGVLKANLTPIATEWFPMAYGSSTLKLKIETVVRSIGGYTVVDDGPSITLHFVYADPAHVDAAGASVATPVAYYSLGGQRLSAQHRGIALVRLSDGRVEKRILR